MRVVCFAFLLVVAAATMAQANFTEDFEGYTPPIPYGKVMFRCPGLSTSTSAKLAYYYAAVLGSDPDVPGNNIVFIGWKWLEDPSVGNWLRLTTHMAEHRPSPAVAFDGQLSFRVLYTGLNGPMPIDPLGICLGLRETGTTAKDGAFGGTSGPIEWVGATGGSATSGPTGVTHFIHPSADWQTLTFNFTTEPVSAFTGNGVLDGTRGALEHLAFTRVAGPGEYLLLLDDFVFISPAVPEPSSLFVITLGCGAFARLWRLKCRWSESMSPLVGLGLCHPWSSPRMVRRRFV